MSQRRASTSAGAKAAHRQLVTDLQRLTDLPARHGEDHWDGWALTSLPEVRRHDARDLERLRRSHGVAGNFNNLILNVGSGEDRVRRTRSSTSRARASTATSRHFFTSNEPDQGFSPVRLRDDHARFCSWPGLFIRTVRDTARVCAAADRRAKRSETEPLYCVSMRIEPCDLDAEGVGAQPPGLVRHLASGDCARTERRGAPTSGRHLCHGRAPMTAHCWAAGRSNGWRTELRSWRPCAAARGHGVGSAMLVHLLDIARARVARLCTWRPARWSSSRRTSALGPARVRRGQPARSLPPRPAEHVHGGAAQHRESGVLRSSPGIARTLVKPVKTATRKRAATRPRARR